MRCCYVRLESNLYSVPVSELSKIVGGECVVRGPSAGEQKNWNWNLGFLMEGLRTVELDLDVLLQVVVLTSATSA